MFDISFAKLVVLGVVALIVLGPERLPAVARFAGLMIGRIQRFVANVKADMNQQLHETGLDHLHYNLKDVTQNIRDGVQSALNEVQDSLKEASEEDHDAQNTQYFDVENNPDNVQPTKIEEKIGQAGDAQNHPTTSLAKK